jgi:hypothetical protein
MDGLCCGWPHDADAANGEDEDEVDCAGFIAADEDKPPTPLRRHFAMSRPVSRSSQRPGSRSSFRAPSPSPSQAAQDVPTDAVALRNQIASAKHEIRQQTARLQHLELTLQRTPRMSATHGNHIASPLSGGHSPTSPETPVLHRRRSLNDTAHADSLIPQPSSSSRPVLIGSLKEGVPYDTTAELSSSSRRARSPHDSISSTCAPLCDPGHHHAKFLEGIPMAAVGRSLQSTLPSLNNTFARKCTNACRRAGAHSVIRD